MCHLSGGRGKVLSCILYGQKSFNECSHLKVVEDLENIMEHL